ncbi:peroxide stress protein YaaA [Moraxella nasovis]|uniref:peroxide stress protein YaaA n=1 Tax=Moraxella nasovis TaxID=2904121 RepID=UPI001F622503|nr:peroxide stress protein YaaA [Moraxella nasovis]UNU72829.1 peroxide stress protein YaaA [Moraxella nasovis]
MYFLLSPAKNLDEKTPVPLDITTGTPALIDDAITLMQTLKSCDVIDIQELMGVSAKIAELNVVRNQHWCYPFDENAKPAAYLFDGDVYTGLDAYQLNLDEMNYLNCHLGILSGLYGLLKPLDMMLPYRLEMGTKFKTPHADDLYQYWGDKITTLINQHMQHNKQSTLINLASNEYYKAVQPKKIKARIITPRFEDEKNGKYKVVSFYAKKARGLMVNFAAKNQITNPDDLKQFNTDGYYFKPNLSDDKTWVFQRNEQL